MIRSMCPASRVQTCLGRHGFLYVGDCKMAACKTWCFIASQDDYYLCPLPILQLAEGEVEASIDVVWS